MGIFNKQIDVDRLFLKGDAKGLGKALHHEDGKIRLDAVRALSALCLGGQEQEDSIRDQYKERYGTEAENAWMIYFLGKKQTKEHEKAVEELAMALDNKDKVVQIEAAITLGRCRDSRSVKALTDIATGRHEGLSNLDYYPEKAGARAVYALCWTEGEEAVKGLLEAAKSRWKNIAEVATEINARRAGEYVASEAYKDLYTDDNFRRIRALLFLQEHPSMTYEDRHLYRVCQLACIGTTSEDAVKVLRPLVEQVARLANDSSDSFVRNRAINALGKIGGDFAVSTLLQALNSEEKETRDGAIRALGESGGPAEMDELVRMLYSRNNEVRTQAVAALDGSNWQANNPKEEVAYLLAASKFNELEIMSESAVEPLIEILNNAGFPEAVLTLGKIGDLRAAEHIIDWLFLAEERAMIIGLRGLEYWTNSLKNLFGDHASMILIISGYINTDDSIDRYPMGFSKGRTYIASSKLCKEQGQYYYHIHQNEEALIELAHIDGQVSTNILNRISQRKNIKHKFVFTARTSIEEYDAIADVLLPFDKQRSLATRALQQKQNPIYDPTQYLNSEAWKRIN